MKIQTAFVFGLASWLLLALVARGTAQTSPRESANSYLERGNQWLKKGEVERAIEDFSFAISFDPALDQAYYNRGLARYIKKDLDGSLADFNRALQLNPKRVEVVPVDKVFQN